MEVDAFELSLSAPSVRRTCAERVCPHRRLSSRERNVAPQVIETSPVSCFLLRVCVLPAYHPDVLKLTNIYYGWWIVAGLFFAHVVSSGFGFYNLSVYMNAIVADRHFAVAEVSFAVTIFFMTGGLAGLWVGRLIERHDVHWIMVAGALVAGAALALSGLATELWQFYVLYGVFGVGNAGVGLVISSTLVTQWFPGASRSIAMSVSSTGLSVGGILITPLSARLINHFGFDTAVPWFGLVFAAALLPIALFLLRAPDQAGELAGTHTHSGASQGFDWEFAAAVRTRFFAFVSLAYVLGLGAQVGGIAHLFNHGERLTDYVIAATAVQVVTAMSITGRILGGYIATKVALRAFAMFNVALQSLGFLLLAMADSKITLLLGAGVFGASIGNLLMLHPLVLADAFGVKAYARIYAWSNLFTTIGVSLGPLVLGVLHDLSGYQLAYGSGVLITLLGFLCLLAAGPRPILQPITKPA